MNTMTKRQMAVAVVESYPFIAMPIPLCELAAQHARLQEDAAAKHVVAVKRQQSSE
jgi:hypothetical protein